MPGLPRTHCGSRVVYALLWTITLLGALLGTAFPGLAPGGRPHPALQESWGELASIAADNARVLSAPFLLAFFRFPAHPRTRQFGDLLIAGVLGANALRVGLALGRWHTRLLPYVPQLPLEWLAAALAGAAWLALRTGARRQTAIAYLAAVLVVVTAAAAVETIATPHAHARTLNVELGSTTAALHSAVPIPARRAGGGLPSLGSCAVAGNRFKVASLPSPRCRSVPLSRLAGAAGLRQPPPDPANWLGLRAGGRRQTAIAYLAAVLVVVTAAAAVETIATPHAHARTLDIEPGWTTAALHQAVPIPARKAGGGLPSLGSCAGAGTRFKVASLPSPRCRSVPLSRLAGAAGLRQPPPDPAKEGPP